MRKLNPTWILVVLVMAGIILYLLSQIRSDSKMDQLLHKAVEGNNITEQWRRSDSAQVTRASANYITADDLRHSSNATIDSLRKDLVGPIKTLERTTRILSTRIEQLTIPVRDTVRIGPDSTLQKGYVFNYSKPPYLVSMRGVQFGTDLVLDYSLKSEFLLEHHWKKTGLFKPRELELIVTAADPAVTVDRVQQFQIVSKVPVFQRPGTTFGMGLLAGLGVSLLVK